jgi:hypothetical protein
MKIIILYLGILLLSLSSFAAGNGSGIMIRPAGMYWSHQFKNGFSPEANTTESHSIASVGMGYRLDTGIYVGGTYTWMQQDTKYEIAGTTTESKSTHTGYGPTVGWVGSNLYLLGTYLISPVHTTGTDAAKSTYSAGTGYQVDLGFMFGITSNFAMGPQFTYYSAEFKKVKNAAGDELDLSGSSVTDIRPMLAFALMF